MRGAEMRFATLAMLLLGGCATLDPAPAGRGIIDTHRHAFERGLPGDSAEEAVAKMEAVGIDRSAIHYATRDTYENWGKGHEARFLKGVSFPCWRDASGDWFACQWDGKALPDIAWLRGEIEAGRLTHFGEIGLVYAGRSPTDPALLPYWSLAAEYGLPVMAHVNRGPPATSGMRARGCCPDFDPDMGDPDLWRPVLQRHPDLKLVLQHFGFPALPVFDDVGYLEQSFALLHDYPNVMADMSTFHSVPFIPAQQHADIVQRLKREGLIDRLVFGSDGWPEDAIIARYEAMDFLTERERQMIYRGNAVRLFGLAD